MKTALEIRANETLFTIADLTPEYQQAARDLYFQPIADRDGVFAKNFPADTPQLETIFANFERNIEPLLRQTAGLAPVRWQAALIDFLDRIAGQSLDWYLVGSAALAVRGMDVAPRDLDIILVGEADVLQVRDLMLDVTVEPFARSENWIGQWFGRSFLHARLEFVGEIVPGVDLLWCLRFWSGCRCPSGDHRVAGAAAARATGRSDARRHRGARTDRPRRRDPPLAGSICRVGNRSAIRD